MKTEVNIDNVVATASIGKDNEETLDLKGFFLFLNDIQKNPAYEKLKASVGNCPAAEFNPEIFPAISIRLLIPRVTIKIFRSLKITAMGCINEEDAKKAVEAGAELVALFKDPNNPHTNIKISSFEISNVMCSSDIGQPVGCGIIQKAFPEREVKISKFGGGSYDLALEGGSAKVFSTGRIMTMGFKSTDAAKRVTAETAQTIIEAIAKYSQNRGDSCRTERLEPTQKLIEEYSKLLNAPEKVKVMASELISQYCKKVTAESFGGSHESFASAAIYIAGIFCGERFTQWQIHMASGVSEVAIRSAKDKIKDVLNLELIL